MMAFPVRKTGDKNQEEKRKKWPAPAFTTLPSGFQSAMAEAKRNGDCSFTFPVEEADGEPVWEPLPLKVLKELQSAVKASGPTAPNTIQVLEMVASHWLMPGDWHRTAKATLSPGDYVL